MKSVFHICICTTFVLCCSTVGCWWDGHLPCNNLCRIPERFFTTVGGREINSAIYENVCL